jgi:hypothetical protein
MKPRVYNRVEDFTDEEVQKFESMHKTLRGYNADLRKGVSAIVPAYTDEEMSLYSTYRQLFLSSETDQ